MFLNGNFFINSIFSLHLSDCEILQRIKIKPTAQCILSLTKRPMHPSTATFLVSLTNGQIQGWSHHRTGGCYITEFEAIHVAGDVSKWLIDVHFALLILMYSFLSLSKLLVFCLFIFMLDNGAKTKQFYFQQSFFFGVFSLPTLFC